MTLDDSVHGLRLHAIQRAAALGNVSAVCRELGISRTLFYRWRKRYERFGVDGVHPRRQRGYRGGYDTVKLFVRPLRAARLSAERPCCASRPRRDCKARSTGASRPSRSGPRRGACTSSC
jgi:hypothetical protein